MNILKLAAQLTLDGTRFKAGLKEAEVASTRFAGSIGSSIKGQLAAAFGGAALVAFATSAVKETAALKDQAEQARMTTTEWQRLKIAAEDASISESEIMSSQNKFNQNRREAVESNIALRETFEKYGMTLEDLQNPQIGFIDFLGKANAALKDMSAEEKAKAGVELFDMIGKAGSKLEGFFQSVEKFKNKPVIAPEAIGGLDKADKKLASIWRSLKEVTALTVGQLVSVPGMIYNAYQQRGALGPDISQADRVRLEEEYNLSRPSKPSEMFTAKEQKDAAEKAKRDAEKAEKDALKLEKDIDTYNFKNLTPDMQRASIEAALQEVMQAGRFDVNSDGPDKRAILELLGQLPQSQFSRPGASSLTSVGQWSGRNFVNSGDSGVVKAAKDLLKPAQDTAQTLKEINAKVVKGKTLNATI